MRRRPTLPPLGSIVIERMPDYSLGLEEAKSGRVWEVLRVGSCYHTILGSALTREKAELLAETERIFA